MFFLLDEAAIEKTIKKSIQTSLKHQIRHHRFFSGMCVPCVPLFGVLEWPWPLIWLSDHFERTLLPSKEENGKEALQLLWISHGPCLAQKHSIEKRPLTIVQRNHDENQQQKKQQRRQTSWKLQQILRL